MFATIPQLPRFRHSLRGFKKCPSCGDINGQRATVCRNVNCEQRQKVLATKRPYDPVQLFSAENVNIVVYSLRSKEAQAHPRSFVKMQADNVQHNAICYVDACKYDTNNRLEPCKHIKVCLKNQEDAAAAISNLPKAEVYPVEREVLWNLNINGEQKQRLWDLCKREEQYVPAVQRINAVTFVVSCEQSKVFPAARLHVTALSNSLTSKKGTHSCACKKLKIIVEPDNSVVMKEEICDHILLVLAAILSKKNGKTVYGNFTNALKSFWMPAALETPLLDATQEDAFFGLSINIGGNLGKTCANEQADDIFIFGNEFDDNIPDFSDIILDLTSADVTPMQPLSLTTATTAAPTNITSTDILYAGDPNLVSSCDITEEDNDIQFNDIATTIGAATTTRLELSDCNIELMDQFQLTDQIDLCSDDITLQSTSELYDTNSISILSATALDGGMQQPPAAAIAIETLDASNATAVTTQAQVLGPQSFKYSTASLLKNKQLMTETTALPTIELPTIAVVKKCPVKSTQIVDEVKTRKFPHIPAKRALIVNTTNELLNAGGEEQQVNGDIEPSLAYTAWLDYVIELLNDSIEISDKTDILHTFHVHEEIFAHFSKSFSTGVKRRMPNSTIAVKYGKHKGLIKYTWYFTTGSTVRRIFTTKNSYIELERIFQCNTEGAFVPYIKKPYIAKGDAKHKRIYPRVSLYMAHICFEAGNNPHKTGVKLEWLPNAFSKSHFGILTIEFSVGIKEPPPL